LSVSKKNAQNVQVQRDTPAPFRGAMADAPWMLHGTPASRLELSFSATGLANEDWVGKSDPLVRVHLRHATGQWAQVGETEVIQNNLNPVWTTAVQVRCHWALSTEQCLQPTTFRF
jgi:Ca2+-dependent lipid-binding protein